MISQDKIKKARESGYSNTEIADYLASQGLADKIGSARNSGYSDDEIVSFLEESPVSSKRQVSKAESALTGFSQGATANFGDEIIAGLAAPVVYVGSRAAEALGYDTRGLADKSLRETYRAEQLKNQQGVAEAEQANPMSYLTGEFGGAITTAVRGGATKGGKAVADYLAKGTLPARIAKTVPISAAASALAGAGAASADNVTEGALKGAATGAALAPLGVVIGDAINRVANKFIRNAPRKIPQTSQEIQDLATQSYKQADELGGNLSPSFTNEFLDSIEIAKPKPIAGKVLTNEDQAFIKSVEDFADLRNSPLNLGDAERIDKALTSKITAALNNGRATPESRVLNEIQRKFRNALENPKEGFVVGDRKGIDAYRKATSLWAQSAKLRDIEAIILRAEMTDNPATALKTGFRNYYNNIKKSRGHSEEERKLIKKAAESGVVTDLLKTFGSRLIPLIAAASGQGLGATAAGTASSMASRSLATKNQMMRAEDVIRAIANRNQPTVLTRGVNTKYSLIAPALSSVLSNNGVGGISSARAEDNLSEEQIRAIMLQQNKDFPNSYTPKEIKENPKIIKNRFYRKN